MIHSHFLGLNFINIVQLSSVNVMKWLWWGCSSHSSDFLMLYSCNKHLKAFLGLNKESILFLDFADIWNEISWPLRWDSFWLKWRWFSSTRNLMILVMKLLIFHALLRLLWQRKDPLWCTKLLYGSLKGVFLERFYQL